MRCFIICRDRVTHLKQLVSWLERAGQEDITLIDNDSSYPPLLEYYESTPHKVVRVGGNAGHMVLWKKPGLVGDPYKPFLLSDPDVVPTEDCPLDAINYLEEVLKKYPHLTKAGLGLKLDDLPDHYHRKREVLKWEDQFWADKKPDAPLYYGEIDTTFAIYPKLGQYSTRNAIRTGYPYLARHMPWYADSANPTEEELYYRSRFDSKINNW